METVANQEPSNSEAFEINGYQNNNFFTAHKPAKNLPGHLAIEF